MKTVIWTTGIVVAIVATAVTRIEASEIDQSTIAAYQAGLDSMTSIWKEVRDIHPYLEKLQPVAVITGEHLVIFEADSSGERYEFRQIAPVPFPMSPNMRAAFPLQALDARAGCVVGPAVFQSLEEMVLVLHEFVHCAQWNSVEMNLKNTLAIAKRAAEKQDYMWEINHPFPYDDSVFVECYGGMISALAAGDTKWALACRDKIRSRVDPLDWEYLVWEEWKEGMARLLENEIRTRMGVKLNTYGAKPPYDRVVFYRGGELYIDYLVNRHPEWFTDTEGLFGGMR